MSLQMITIQMKTFSKHPTDIYQVYATLYACHMIKLAGSILRDINIFKSPNNFTVEQKHIHELYTFRKIEGVIITTIKS